jgi:hypothetical protein
VRTFYTTIKGGSLHSPPRPPGHAGRAIRSGRSRRIRSAAAETSSHREAVQVVRAGMKCPGCPAGLARCVRDWRGRTCVGGTQVLAGVTCWLLGCGGEPGEGLCAAVGGAFDGRPGCGPFCVPGLASGQAFMIRRLR